MLQAAGRGRDTIKQFVRELRGPNMVRKISMKHKTRSRTRDCAAVWIGWKVTIPNIVHDKIRTRVERIYRQNRINEPRKGGMIKFEFKEAYKAQVAHHQPNLGRFKWWHYQTSRNLMNLETVKSSLWFEALLKDIQESLIRIMTTTRGAAQSSTPLVGDAPKIPKSPWMPRPKKDP